MSRTISFTLLLLTFASKALAQGEHTVAWNKDHPINWSDFKGTPDTLSKFHASSYYEIFADYKWTVKNNKYAFTFNTGSFLNTARSWSVKEKQTPELLRHEQLHFDIAELFARIYLRLLTKQVYTAAFQSEISRINEDNLRNLKVLQGLYDEQTDHSEDKYMQARWEAYIAKLLKDPTLIDASALRGPKKPVL